MSDRDPRNTAPRGGGRAGREATGRDYSDRDQGRADDPRSAQQSQRVQGAGRGRRQPGPAPGRQQGGSGRSGGAAPSRDRFGVPPPVSSRDVREEFDPFAEPPLAPRRSAAESGADPFASGRRTSRSSQSVPPSDDPNDPAAWADLTGEWAEPSGSEWEELPAIEPEPRPAPSRRRARRAPRETSRSAGRPRVRPSIDLGAARMPSFMGRADLLTDQVSGILLGANLLSLIVMIIWLATAMGRLPEVMVMHLDPAGFPDGWGTPTVLWRLPLIAGMTLLMNLVVAWFVAPIDRFAARFVLAAALGVQLIVWVAVLDFI